ncbi:trp operon leader peptide [Streptomyces sp. NPDC014733]|uniref:trp operon leader peptide n=1 Tax=Streptomyces sp. NPDC014733 TaxID=3364885 RepID=UPI0036FE0675
MRRTAPAGRAPRPAARCRFTSVSGPLHAAGCCRVRPSGVRTAAPGRRGSGRVPGMYAQHVTNWWWTAHPAAR